MDESNTGLSFCSCPVCNLCITLKEKDHGFGLKYVRYVMVWVQNLLLLRVQAALRWCY